MKSDRDLPENVHDFVDEISNTKSHIQRCIKLLIKETNKNKLDYGQLRYIFRRVREECGIEIKANKKSLYELPNREGSKHRVTHQGFGLVYWGKVTEL